MIFLEPTAAGEGTVGATDVQIAMQSKQFVPRVRVVTTGSRVNFPNQDPVRHNVFSNTRTPHSTLVSTLVEPRARRRSVVPASIRSSATSTRE